MKNNIENLRKLEKIGGMGGGELTRNKKNVIKNMWKRKYLF